MLGLLTKITHRQRRAGICCICGSPRLRMKVAGNYLSMIAIGKRGVGFRLMIARLLCCFMQSKTRKLLA